MVHKMYSGSNKDIASNKIDIRFTSLILKIISTLLLIFKTKGNIS